MKLSETRGHLFSIAIAAGLAACTHAAPKPDTTAEQAKPKQEEMKPVEAAKPVTPEAFHARGRPTWTRRSSSCATSASSSISTRRR